MTGAHPVTVAPLVKYYLSLYAPLTWMNLMLDFICLGFSELLMPRSHCRECRE